MITYKELNNSICELIKPHNLELEHIRHRGNRIYIDIGSLKTTISYRLTFENGKFDYLDRPCETYTGLEVEELKEVVDISKIIEPLTELIKKGITWNKEK